MTALKTISDFDLLKNTKKLVAQERELLTDILHHLAELESRQLFLKMGFGSLWDYCVEELSYSHAAAGRRISAMRLMKELPSLEKPILEGTLNLSTLSTVQSFLKQEKIHHKTYSKEDKLVLLKKVENKSTRECLNILAQISPQSVIKPEKIKPVSSTDVEITVTVSQDFLKEIEELKSLVSHQLKSGTISEVLRLSVQKVLSSIKKKKGMTKPKQTLNKKSDADLKKTNLENTSDFSKDLSITLEKSRYYTAESMRTTWQRAQNYCEFIDSITKKRCTSTWKLEIDHVQPHSLGGSNESNNLRLLCGAHHGLFTVQTFGRWGENNPSINSRGF